MTSSTSDVESAAIKVSLDGGKTWLDAHDGLRVVVHDVPLPIDGESAELHMNFTEEGLISDVWVRRDVDCNLGTASREYADVVGDLFDPDVIPSERGG